jgi:hypothetical protein
MVDFNELKNKAQDLVAEHSEQVKSGIEKVGGLVGGRIGHDRTDGVEQKLSGLVDKIAGDKAGGAAAPRTAAPGSAASSPVPPVPDPIRPDPAAVPDPADPTIPKAPGV